MRERDLTRVLNVLLETTKYLSLRLEFPPRGKVGRNEILPALREAIKIMRRKVHGTTEGRV